MSALFLIGLAPILPFALSVFIFLCLSALFGFYSVGETRSGYDCIPAIMFMLVPVFSGVVCGVWLEKSLSNDKSPRILPIVGMICASSLVLSNSGFVSLIGAAVRFMHRPSGLIAPMQLFSVMISIGLSCAALTALALILVSLACELPCVLILRILGHDAALRTVAFRPILLVLAIGFGMNLIVSLWSRELAPLNIIRMARNLYG